MKAFALEKELVQLGKWRRGWRDGRYFYPSRFAKTGNLHVCESVLPPQGLFQPVHTVLLTRRDPKSGMVFMALRAPKNIAPVTRSEFETGQSFVESVYFEKIPGNQSSQICGASSKKPSSPGTIPL
jgi:hypothetical protein